VQSNIDATNKNLNNYIGANQAALAPSKTVKSVALITPAEEDKVAKQAEATALRTIGIIGNYEVFKDGKPVDNAVFNSMIPSYIKNVGIKLADGRIPITIGVKAPGTKVGDFTLSKDSVKEYTILVSPTENEGTVVAVKNYMSALYMNTNQSAIMQMVMNGLNGKDVSTQSAYQDFDYLLPNQKTGEFALGLNVSQYSNQGALKGIKLSETPSVKVTKTNAESGAGKVDYSSNPALKLYGTLKVKYPQLSAKIKSLPSSVTDKQAFDKAISRYSIEEQQALRSLSRLQYNSMVSYGRKEVEKESREEIGMVFQDWTDVYTDAVKALASLSEADLHRILK
jgi:hypothetical protein